MRRIEFCATLILGLAAAGSLQAQTVAHWDFEEFSIGTGVIGVGATINDLSGNNRHLTNFDVANDVVDGMETGSKAIRFSGVCNGDIGICDYLELQSNDFQLGTGDFTLEALVFLPAPNSSGGPTNREGGIMGKGINDRGANTDALWFVNPVGPRPTPAHPANSTLIEAFFDDKVQIVRPVVDDVAAGWRHIAVVRNGLTVSTFIDGQQLNSKVAVGPFNLTTTAGQNFVVGTRESFGNPNRMFGGDIDEIRISSVALTPDQFFISFETAGPTGDYNGNGRVEAGDFLLWQRTFGASVPAGTGADGSGNGLVDGPDFDFWKTRFGSSATPVQAAVPEPGSLALLMAAAMIAGLRDGDFCVSNWIGERIQIRSIKTDRGDQNW